jgi:hypothetical protein
MVLDRRAILKGMAAGFVATGIRSDAENVAALAEIYASMRIWDVRCHLEAVPGDTPEKRIEVLVRNIDGLASSALCSERDCPGSRQR